MRRTTLVILSLCLASLFVLPGAAGCAAQAEGPATPGAVIVASETPAVTLTSTLASVPAGPLTFAPAVRLGEPAAGRPAVLAGLPGGGVAAAYISLDNTTLYTAASAAPGAPFTTTALDSSPAEVGSQHLLRDARGRLSLIWYHNLVGRGTTVVYYASRDPAQDGVGWQSGPIPGSQTGPATNGAFKVLGLAGDGQGRIYALWARNFVGARLAWTDDGHAWSAVETVPGPFSRTASDFALAVTADGTVAVAWFDRESGDVHMQMRAPGSVWSAPEDVSARPAKGQDYTPRLAADPAGGLRLAWTGYTDPANTQTDGFYREWTRAGGWRPIVPVYETPGKGNPGGLQLAVDSAGVAHVVWDDDTGSTPGHVLTYYARGTQAGFSAPQPVFPTLSAGLVRLPSLAVSAGPGDTARLYVTANSDVDAPSPNTLVNFVTWSDLGPAPSASPPSGPAPPAGAARPLRGGSGGALFVKLT